MLVIHIVDSEGLYGAEAVILTLAEGLRHRGIDAHIFSLGDIGVPPKAIEQEAGRRGIPIHPLRFRRGLNPLGTVMILRKAHDLGADLLHSHGYKGNILLGITPRSLRKIPVLATLHGWTSTRKLSRIWIYECMDALTLRYMDQVVVVSTMQCQHQRIRRFGLHPVIIHNGVSELDFSFRTPMPLLFSKDQNKQSLLIVSIGRLSLEKGYSVLLSALKEVADKGIDARLVLFGGGNEKESLAALAERKSLSSKVHFMGYQEEAYRFLTQFDLFVLPSFTEGLPITVLEAMQAGIPIIATEVGEIPNLLEHGKCGYLVKPGDSNRLAEAIEHVFLFRQEAFLKAELAQQRALTEYGVEKMIAQYLQEYEKVISRVQHSSASTDKNQIKIRHMS